MRTLAIFGFVLVMGLLGWDAEAWASGGSPASERAADRDPGSEGDPDSEGAADTSEHEGMEAAPETLDSVVINGVVLEQEELGEFERQFGLRIPPGSYWYDRFCGAWGVEGGPTIGFTLANLPLGGTMAAHASGGSSEGQWTGVFVNGRELHPVDVMALNQLLPVGPGRYWLDAFGNAGYENGPAMVNLFMLAKNQGGGGGAYQSRTAGGYIGSDGTTSYFFDPETGSSVMTE